MNSIQREVSPVMLCELTGGTSMHLCFTSHSEEICMPLTCLEQDVSKDVYFYAESSTPPHFHLFLPIQEKTQQMYFYQLLRCPVAKAQLHKSFKQMFTSLDINTLPHILAAV